MLESPDLTKSKQRNLLNNASLFQMPIKQHLGPRTRAYYFKGKREKSINKHSMMESRSVSMSNLDSISIQGTLQEVKEMISKQRKERSRLNGDINQQYAA